MPVYGILDLVRMVIGLTGPEAGIPQIYALAKSRLVEVIPSVPRWSHLHTRSIVARVCLNRLMEDGSSQAIHS